MCGESVDTRVSECVRVCAPFLRRDFNGEHTTHILLQLPPPFLHVHL